VVFLSTGGTLKELAFIGQPMPEGGGAFSLFTDVALNDKGQVAFSCLLVSTSFSGIYLADNNSLRVLAKGGQALPDDDGRILTFPSTLPALNNKGEIAFVATLTGTTVEMQIILVCTVQTRMGSRNWRERENLCQAEMGGSLILVRDSPRR
jgi:hypothetical protein